MKLEQLSHGPQRRLVDLVEIERGVDLLGRALENLEFSCPAGEPLLRPIRIRGTGVVGSVRHGSSRIAPNTERLGDHTPGGLR